MIEIIRDEHDFETRQARHDWAKITGTTTELKPSIIRDDVSKQDYAAISGAIGWPTALEPGCMIVAGVGDRRIQILEYREYRSVYDLIDAVVTVRYEYKFGEFAGILPDWIADPDRYQALATETSAALEQRQGPGRGLYIREPADWYEPNAFPIYAWQMRNALEKKTLKLGGHVNLVNRLQAFQQSVIDKGKVFDYPAVGILGALTHTILSEKSWEQDIDHGKPFNLEV